MLFGTALSSIIIYAIRKRKKKRDPVLVGNEIIGTKGQFVVPIEIRKKLKIKPDDKLMVFGNRKTKIIAVVKTKQITKLMKDITSLEL